MLLYMDNCQVVLFKDKISALQIATFIIGIADHFNFFYLFYILE